MKTFLISIACRLVVLCIILGGIYKAVDVGHRFTEIANAINTVGH